MRGERRREIDSAGGRRRGRELLGLYLDRTGRAWFVPFLCAFRVGSLNSVVSLSEVMHKPVILAGSRWSAVNTGDTMSTVLTLYEHCFTIVL